MNSLAARLLPLLAVPLVLVSCQTAGSLQKDPGFSPPPATSTAGLPGGLDFDPGKLSAAQCAAWLDQKLPPYIWHGEERDFTLTSGRVVFTRGHCRQYRVFSSPTVRTWHLREIPVKSVTSNCFGPVVSALNAPAADRNHYFEVSGPWTRQWETLDLTTQKVTAHGKVKAGNVTLHFTTRAAAEKARAVMMRLATLLQSGAELS